MVPWTGGKDSVCWVLYPLGCEVMCNHYGREGPHGLLVRGIMALKRKVLTMCELDRRCLENLDILLGSVKRSFLREFWV
jgi:hypothetical protein